MGYAACQSFRLFDAAAYDHVYPLTQRTHRGMFREMRKYRSEWFMRDIGFHEMLIQGTEFV